MTIKSTGSPLKFSDIVREFGSPTGNKLGNYRVNQEVGDADFRLDEGIPTSGSISFSNFYSKSLNVVVHYSSSENRPSNARSRYNDNSGVTVIGGFKSKPGDSSGTRVIIHVSSTIGGGGGRTSCSLRTGTSWEEGTKLDIEIGNEGRVYGRGGGGGEGGGQGEGETDDQRKADANGENGGDGSSAIGISYFVENINVQSGGRVYGGGGGGGGSGGARNEEEQEIGGSGGGGGAGVPAGAGGGGRDNGNNGGGGSTTSGGNGGKGKFDLDGERKGVKAGGGGGGGSWGSVGEGGERGGAPGNGNADDDDAEDGENGGPDNENNENRGGEGGGGDAEKNEQAEGSGGNGGFNGYAIIISGVSAPNTSGETDQIRGGTSSQSFS